MNSAINSGMNSGMNARHVGACAIALLGLSMLAPAVTANASTLYGLLNTGELYASTDHGATWSARAALPVRDAVALRARSSALELYLAAASGFVGRSNDGGTNWDIAGAVAASDVADLLVLPGGDLLLLTAAGTVYRSADLGGSFTAMAEIGGSGFVALARASTGEICALTRTGEVHASGDEGSSWGARSAIPVSDAVDLASASLGLCVLTGTGEIERSTDAGWTWHAIGTLSQVGSRALVPDSTTLVAATREGHVATSPDGQAWTWAGSINQLSLTALAVDTPGSSAVEELPFTACWFFASPCPNPAPASGGVLAFDLAQEDLVEFVLLDATGRVVARRNSVRFSAGAHEFQWAPTPPSAGVYFVRMVTGLHGVQTRRWVMTTGAGNP
jgi:hypothetical protein